VRNQRAGTRESVTADAPFLGSFRARRTGTSSAMACNGTSRELSNAHDAVVVAVAVAVAAQVELEVDVGGS
jgi:hypothetical protein